MFALDLDYYSISQAGLTNVYNFSLGGEWYMNAEHAFRGGYYTNRDNRVAPNSTSAVSLEKLDMQGLTLGYSSYTTTTSFTIGVVITQGQGETRIYRDSLETRKIHRSSHTLIFAANYNY